MASDVEKYYANMDVQDANLLRWLAHMQSRNRSVRDSLRLQTEGKKEFMYYYLTYIDSVTDKYPAMPQSEWYREQLKKESGE